MTPNTKQAMEHGYISRQYILHTLLSVFTVFRRAFHARVSGLARFDQIAQMSTPEVPKH